MGVVQSSSEQIRSFLADNVCWLWAATVEHPLRSPPQIMVMEPSMQRRRHFRQIKTLEVRLAEEESRLREQARMLPRGRLRDEVERKAEQFEAACEVPSYCLPE
jgi:hypothetical protein